MWGQKLEIIPKFLWEYIDISFWVSTPTDNFNCEINLCR